MGRHVIGVHQVREETVPVVMRLGDIVAHHVGECFIEPLGEAIGFWMVRRGAPVFGLKMVYHRLENFITKFGAAVGNYFFGR